MTRLLSIRHLEMLAASDATHTLADAAAVLRITPSALTHRIREAERRLGLQLFQKRGRVLSANAAAQILTHAAERLLSGLQHAEHAALASVAGVRHVIRLSVAFYNAFHWLPDFLLWFRAEWPEIDIAIETQGAHSPFDSLARNDVDVVLAPGVVLTEALTSLPLFADELVAILPPSHPLAGQPYLKGKDFLEETYLTYSLIRQPGFEAERVWTPENVMPLREKNIGSVDAICELIRAAQGVSILSHWAVRPRCDAGGLVPVRVTRNGLDITWQVVFKRGLGPGTAEHTLAKALTTWFEANPPPGLKLPVAD